jgi:hypothetical protein
MRVTKLSESYITSEIFIFPLMHSSTIVAIGMEASVGVFTSSLGHRDLYHHMILPINIPTVMQMLTRFATFKLQFYCPRNFLATQCLIKKKKNKDNANQLYFPSLFKCPAVG